MWHPFTQMRDWAEGDPLIIEKADKLVLEDVDGKQYLDGVSSLWVNVHGHKHPRLVKALVDQAKTLGITSRAFHHDKLAPFLQRACELTKQDQALAMNTGAEAVETALKAARKWGEKVKGIPKNKAKIIACEGNFHGRTIAIVGMSTEEQYKDGFGPFPKGFETIPFGNSEALEKKLAKDSSNYAAFLVEPIQGEGGIIVPPKGYLKECQRICQEHNVLLICDEIQTGLGRTGKILASQYDSVVPDALLLGKALGGGLIPVSLFLSKKEVMDVFTPGDHGSTFGGYPIAAAVGLEALNVLIDDRLSDRAKVLGDYMQGRLKELNNPAIVDVRGKGLLIGVQLDPNIVDAHEMCERLLKLGILGKETHHNTMRFAPPLVITQEQIDWAIAQFVKALNQ